MVRKAKSENVLVVFKPLGKTPLDVVRSLQEKDPSLRDLKIGYAGRLDPMAEGVLVLLLGEENKNKAKYEKLEKEYLIKILLGFSTDTYDILGKSVAKNENFVIPYPSKIKKVLAGFVGKFDQPYPPYSSKAVGGKPLYYYARRNLLSKIKIPSRGVEIFSIKEIDKSEIKGIELLELIIERISLVAGDFRQKEIIKTWEEQLLPQRGKKFSVFSFRVKCSSGTYMRTLSNSFGEKLGVASLALSIKRLSVGKYSA